MEISSTATLKETPLAEAHVRAGGRMVEFGGWLMPVQYSSILEEHAAVRRTAGLFDISHMGEFVVSGSDAGAWLNQCLTNDLDKLRIGQGQYTLMLNEKGGVIDDLIVYRTATDRYFLVVNASKIDEDFSWLKRLLPEKNVTLKNESDETGALALQGPNAESILQAILGSESPLPSHYEIKSFRYHEIELQIARTGYTGEDGFEIFFPASAAVTIWDQLLAAGKDFGMKPCGLGARDTLRLEMCYPLNGNDLSSDKTPLEAGLKFFVSLTKSANFPGKEKLQQQTKEGLKKKLVAFKMRQKGAPPRAHYPLYAEEIKIGEATSGCLSPSLGYGIGMGYVDAAYSAVDQQIEVEVRGARLPAVVIKKPFYKKP